MALFRLADAVMDIRNVCTAFDFDSGNIAEMPWRHLLTNNDVGIRSKFNRNFSPGGAGDLNSVFSDLSCRVRYDILDNFKNLYDTGSTTLVVGSAA